MSCPYQKKRKAEIRHAEDQLASRLVPATVIFHRQSLFSLSCSGKRSASPYCSTSFPRSAATAKRMYIWPVVRLQRPIFPRGENLSEMAPPFARLQGPMDWIVWRFVMDTAKCFQGARHPRNPRRPLQEARYLILQLLLHEAMQASAGSFQDSPSEPTP